METSEAIKLNQEVFKNIQISSQENMIIKSLDKFYEDTSNINLFISIINPDTQGVSSISIRLIDHFVTKYSKTNKINYRLKENDIEQTFNVHTSYKQQLKAFQKRHFDPFSRGDRVPYFMGNSCIITTIGQLNFFKWFISKKIYNYIMDNQYNIENDMNRRNKNDINKMKKDKKPRKLLKHNIIIPQTSNMCYSSNRPILLSESKKEKIVVSFTF
jgi:hypothetical protein